MIPLFLDNLLRDVLGRFCSSYPILQNILLLSLCAWSAHWFAWCSSNLCDSSCWLVSYRAISEFLLSQLFLSTSASATDNLLWTAHSPCRARSWRFFLSDKILSLSCWHNDTLPKSPSLFPLNSDLSTFEEDSSPRFSFPKLPTFRRMPKIYHTWWCWLLLAAACCCLLKNRHTEGMCTYFSLLREQWWSQLSRLNGFCDVRRNDCSNVINVGAATVLSWRKVHRRVIAGDLDQVFGIITCSEALFSHLAKPWTAPWIGAGCAWFRTAGKRGGGSGTPSMLRWNMWRQDDFWETADSNAQLILNQRMCVDEVSRAREKCASVVRTVTCSVFTSRRVHDIHKCLYAIFFFLKKNNRPTGKEICKVTWWFRTSALIRSIPAIRANLVVLATVGVPTRLPKMKGMTPVIQISFDNFDFAIPSLIAAVRWMVAVVLVLLEGM